MRIQNITPYKSSINLKQNLNNNNRNANPSFGFGEDYGVNPFIEPEFENGSDQNFFKAVGYMFAVPVVIVKEVIENKIEERRQNKEIKRMLEEEKAEKLLEKELEQQAEIAEDDDDDLID